MTSSHIPTRPNSTATYTTDIFPERTVAVDGGGGGASTLLFDGMF